MVAHTGRMTSPDSLSPLPVRAALSRMLATLALAAAFLLAAPPAAVAQEGIPCGTLYRVAPGDTLHSIAVRAYDEGDNYLTIFEANRDILPSATRIEIGDQLLIPCLDGSGAQTRGEILPPGEPPGEPSEDTGESATARSTAAAPGAAVPADVEIGLLTGSGFAPFADPALPEGGMATELVRLALDRAAPDRSSRIAVAEDWAAHLDLLARGTFHLGFPWYRPDCDRADRLGASMQRRCAEFAFSEPLFELEIAYYARTGHALTGAEGHDALLGHRICRPATYFTFDLTQEGLAAPDATLVFPPEAEECFVLLEAGVVDVVTLARAVAESEITRLGLTGKVAEIPALASTQTLHVIAPEDSPEALAFLSLIDAGLAELRESGRWFEVVSRHLGPFGVSLR